VAIVWAVVASLAAFQLGIRADLALLVAAAALVVDAVAPSALGPRPRFDRALHPTPAARP
jgi:hypothetical protein